MYRFYRTHYAAERNPLVNLAVYCGIALNLIATVVRTEARRSLRALRGANA
jgi:hypothetical protein